MYTHEINEWIAEVKTEEKQSVPNVAHNIEDPSGDSTSDSDHLVMNGNLRQ